MTRTSAPANYWSPGLQQQVTRIAADVDPALPPARSECVSRRADGEFQVMGPCNKGTYDGVAHIVTCELEKQVLVGGEESEIGLPVRPSLFRLPSPHADRAADG